VVSEVFTSPSAATKTCVASTGAIAVARTAAVPSTAKAAVQSLRTNAVPPSGSSCSARTKVGTTIAVSTAPSTSSAIMFGMRLAEVKALAIAGPSTASSNNCLPNPVTRLIKVAKAIEPESRNSFEVLPLGFLSWPLSGPLAFTRSAWTASKSFVRGRERVFFLCSGPPRAGPAVAAWRCRGVSGCCCVLRCCAGPRRSGGCDSPAGRYICGEASVACSGFARCGRCGSLPCCGGSCGGRICCAG